MGKSGRPSGSGYRIPYPEGDSTSILKRFRGRDVTIKLQNGWKTSELR